MNMQQANIQHAQLMLKQGLINQMMSRVNL